VVARHSGSLRKQAVHQVIVNEPAIIRPDLIPVIDRVQDVRGQAGAFRLCQPRPDIGDVLSVLGICERTDVRWLVATAAGLGGMPVG
jgi:hypothetical protein